MPRPRDKRPGRTGPTDRGAPAAGRQRPPSRTPAPSGEAPRPARSPAAKPYAARPPAAKPYAAKPYAPRPQGAQPRGKAFRPPARRGEDDAPEAARQDRGGPQPARRPSRPPPAAQDARPARTPRPQAPRDQAPRSGAPRPTSSRPDTSRPDTSRTDAQREDRRSSEAQDPTPERPPARRPADAPRGAVWLHGLHPVAAALANPRRNHRRLLLTPEAATALAARVPQPWPVEAEVVQRARLDAMLGREVVHQGAALLSDLLVAPALAEVLERPGPVVVLDQVTDPRNVGAVLRCAAAFGAACVVLQERHAPEETGALAKAASGALEQVPLLRAVNLSRTLAALKEAGLWVVGLEADAAPLSGAALGERRAVLVFGAEGSGLRRLTREGCDELAGLHMPGGFESLNVSAAAAVALYELGRK